MNLGPTQAFFIQFFAKFLFHIVTISSRSPLSLFKIFATTQHIHSNSAADLVWIKVIFLNGLYVCDVPENHRRLESGVALRTGDHTQL